MSALTVLRRDVFSKFTGELVSRAVFLLFFIYLGRKLSPAGFGTLILAMNTAFILGVVFFDPGLNLAAVQQLVVSPGTARRDAGAVLAYKVLVGIPVVLLVLAAGSALLGSRLPALPVLLLAGLYNGLYAVLEYLCYVTNAYHRIELEAGFKTLGRVLMVVLGVLALLLFQSVELILLAICVATAIAILVAWFILRRACIAVPLAWNSAAIKALLKAGLPMAATLVVGAIYLKWDLFLLASFNIGREQIGWYAGAFKIVEALSAVPSMIGAALFPTFVQLHREDRAKFARLLRVATKLVLLVAVPVAVMISAYSRQIITLVYGASFFPAANVLAILIWCIVPMFLFFYLIWVNIAAGKAKHNLYAGVAALGTGLALNALLLPRIGYTGAAWAALLANCVFALLCTYRVASLFQKAHIPGLLAQLLAAGFFMVVGLHFAPEAFAWRILFALGGYTSALLLLRIVGAEDFSLALRALRFRAAGQS